MSTESNTSVVHSVENKTKWSVAHFPIGTIAKASFDFGEDKKEFVFTVIDVIKNGIKNYCLKTNLSGDHEFFNMCYVTKIIKRGEGQVYHATGAQEIIESFQRSSSIGNYISARLWSLFLIAPYLKSDMLVDPEKLINLLIQQGVLKFSKKDNCEKWVVSYKKKKARKAAKRILNKCLIKHKIALEEEQEEYYKMLDGGWGAIKEHA